MDELPVAPPQNIGAEMELLGALLAYYTPRIADDVAQTGLTGDDFYRPWHGAVFEVIQGLRADDEHVDTLTVGRRLGDEHMTALDALAAHCVPHGVRERAVVVREDAEWRRRLLGLYEAAVACHARDKDRYAAALPA